ncbi:hypothetical protein BJ742DRAFT_844021 [Cladochytrium replicatum]|nr:hypothetical protein BJ742DRAFT_844021 [Cladochytrium replicatum]
MSKSADSLVATTSDGNSSDNATIRVRCPSAATESDFIVDAKLSSTVRELKERLSVDSPWRPRVADQRIIFVGKVLEDSLSLRDALAKVDTSLPQTVHLVVRGGGVSPVREPIHPKEAETSPPVDTPAADARVPTDPRPIDPPAEPSVEASPPSDTPNSAEALSGVPFLMHLQRLGVPYEIVVIG